MTPVVDLSRPVGRKRVRGFQPPWRMVFVYRCAAGHTFEMRASTFRGQHAVPSIGAVTCPHCARTK